jgi:hypothetical protein
VNKQKFIDYLRSPERLTEEQFTDLQTLLVDYPYFTIAKSMAARAARDLDHPSKSALVASAAIYATDRKHLKKFINGELVFLAEKPIVSDDSEITAKPTRTPELLATPDVPTRGDLQAESSSAEKAPTATVHPHTDGEVDQIIDELHRDMHDLKKSRMHFVEIQNQLDEEAASLTQRKVESKEEVPVEPTLETASEPELDAKSQAHASDVIEVSEVAEKAPEISPKSTPSNEAPIKFDLDALKRELALEEEKEKEEKSISKPESQPVPKEKKERPQRAPRVRRSDDEDDDEDMKEPPPVVNVPGSITNMSPAEENDEDDDFDMPLPRKRPANRPKKEVKKIKREDLEKILGKKAAGDESKTTPKEEKPKLETKTSETEKKPKETDITKEAPAEKTPRASRSDKQPMKIKRSDLAVGKSAFDKLEQKADQEANPASSSENKQEVSKDVNEKTSIETPVSKAPTVEKQEVAEPSSEKSTPVDLPSDTSLAVTPELPKDEEPARNSIKAFLDLGISVERTSVSRASSSRSKRGARANRSRPSDEGKSGGKDDDESGGTGSLIDKFIQENPSIQRRQLKDDKADLSQDSGKWNPELASEYLAQIYLDQGNTKRAILIYETLSLKFPEKKSYFAGLIEKLKK